MANPQLTVLGVYRPVINEETWREQWQVTEDDGLTKDHFDKLVLIEAIVEGLDEPFNMLSFGQIEVVYPNDLNRFQVGYDEGLLSADGQTLIERTMGCVEGTGPLRFAAYLHQYDPTRPVTQALFRPNVSHDYDDGLADLLDVVGQNYREQEILKAHADKPTRKIIGTENTHDRNQWVAMRDHPEYSGQFLWSGIDYLGEAGRWPGGRRCHRQRGSAPSASAAR